MATGYIGGDDGYIPTLDLSGNLMIGFSRNVKKYPVNRYVSLTPVKKSRGAYLYFRPQDNAKFPNLPNSTKWASGTVRPQNGSNLRGFEERTFTTTRHSFETLLDKRAVDLANWPVMKRHTEELAKDAMVARAIRCVEKMFDATQYDSSHVVTASSLAGGFLDGGNSADPRILKAFTEADRLIQNDTGGRVTPGELSVLMNHNTAIRLSRSRELREYVMQQEDAWKQIVLNKDSYNSAYYLPDVLYRHNVVVESLMYNASPKGAATETFTPIVEDNSILVFLREGDLESEEGEASYSTCHQFVYEDMNVETWPDDKNRLVTLTVTDETDEQIVAPVTAVKITNVFE
jgi:hypothetical protein